jgi:hypothetical protein
VISLVEDEYADIRPYHDDEVRGALDRLLADDEFISTIVDIRIRNKSKVLSALAYPFVRKRLKRMFDDIHNVYDVQELVKEFLDRMLATTSRGFSVSGLDQLAADEAYLFIGNHRDIVLDPALVNYALKSLGRDTVRIAIGDNLQSKSFIADLMKLNKSFTVKRGINMPRERVMALRHLSEYINHSIMVDRASIWIAQGEGRAKDGNDRTQPAIIKMIAMSKSKDESFGDFINRMNIVPVTISYEYDPCDADKARELHIRAQTGSYHKRESEDFESILKGIRGYKGHIHVAFGTPLKESYADAQEVAGALDHQIIPNYQVRPAHIVACDQIGLKYDHGRYDIPNKEEIDYFLKRMEAIPKEYREVALASYAQVVKNQMNY